MRKGIRVHKIWAILMLGPACSHWLACEWTTLVAFVSYPDHVHQTHIINLEVGLAQTQTLQNQFISYITLKSGAMGRLQAAIGQISASRGSNSKIIPEASQ